MMDTERVYDYKKNVLRIFVASLVLISAAYIALFIATDSPIIPTVYTSLFTMMYLAYFILLRKLRFTVAANLALWTATIHICFASLFILEKETGLHYFLIAAGPVAYSLLDAKPRLYRLCFVLFSIALLLMLEVVPDPAKLTQLDSRLNEALRLATLLGAFALSSVPTALFSLQIQNNELTYYQRSIIDPLTGLYNRGYLTGHLRHVHEVSQRYKRCYSILVLDIDHFKSINDRHGHDAGDTVLKEISEVLRVEARISDVVFRYGGEEFLVLLPETDVSGAVVLAERLRAKISEMKSAISQVKTTVSVGIGIGPGSGSDNFEHVIQRADSCMYRAKESGRNQVSYPGPDID
jgi:diguanylate cyclase